ncbi:MAG: hypothetical protein JRC89_10635 [Deltaproteobacteria bacterium]|nr:hypothetical protein [Deltaproteobacteria bacterium]MBW2643801.1 hypothetical protein [Deltaproteobacteria bacterium]
MKKNTSTDNPEEKRSELRTVLNRFYSVEFKLKGTGNLYQFKLRDISSKGQGILVNEDSAVLQHLKVKDMLGMKYYPPEASSPSEFLKTQVIHISKKEDEPFKGHFLIGLSIIEKQPIENKASLIT